MDVPDLGILTQIQNLIRRTRLQLPTELNKRLELQTGGRTEGVCVYGCGRERERN